MHAISLSPKRRILGEPFDMLKIEPGSAGLLIGNVLSPLLPDPELAALCGDPRPSSSVLHKDSHSLTQVKENGPYLL